MRYSDRPADGGGGASATDKRRWIVRRVWVVAADGTKRGGTLWYAQEDDVLIRVDHEPALLTLPAASRGERWDFADGRGED
jgi:hypothetical protein